MQNTFLKMDFNKMTITRIYRDRDNKYQSRKEFSFEEVKKDLTKLLSHDNRISNRKDKNDIKRFITPTANS